MTHEEIGRMSLFMKYFVVKPAANKPFDLFAKASRTAMTAYADTIETNEPTFARQIRDWVDREAMRANELDAHAETDRQPVTPPKKE